MDPLFEALSLFRRRRYEASCEICTQQLKKNPYDQAFWTLKMRCLTQQVYVDDLESEEDGIAEMLLNEDAINQLARPGTSLKTAAAFRTPATSQAMRPVSQSGRPITGVLRPGTQGRPDTMEFALKAPRTAKTARPMTSSSGRFVRLGTASMLSVGSDGPFINLARLNVSKYASNNCVSKPLFEYIMIHENDVRLGLELAAQATQHNQFNDWWWKLQLGKCYFKIGMIRDAEKQFRSCLKHQEITVDPYLWLGKVYIKLDQPLAAIQVYKDGQVKFPQEMNIHLARIHEELNDHDEAATLYRQVLKVDAVNIEAVACIAMHHFYSDQPEVALRYYRRILQMGASNAEIYNNLALCCYYSQQFDVTITCFERALLFSDSDETTAEIWYNIAHIVIGVGDKQLATQCLRLALVANNDHSEAYNNLGVIEANRGNLPQAKALFQAAHSTGKHLYEPHFNLSIASEKTGHYDIALCHSKETLKLYPNFYGATAIFTRLRKMYESV